MPLPESISRLQETVEKLVVPGHCSGTYPLQAGKAGLFYFADNDHTAVGGLDFASPNGVPDTRLEDLVKACEPAKFGLGDRDVLDETYRKAWKLDASKLATQFDVVRSGILTTVHDALLQYESSTLLLEAHVDKLNVYGPGSFFKPHVDTPRDPNMLGTLVIVFPTEHRGGDLLLTTKAGPWTFDSSNLVSKEQSEVHRLAFVAFYSDIEHEVTLVESGYRVTLTYNLYTRKPMSPLDPSISIRVSPEEQQIQNALRTLLADETFLPDGGAFGFGLTHKYPLTNEHYLSQFNWLKNFSEFEGCLKGSDSLVERACKALGLSVKVQALFRNIGTSMVEVRQDFSQIIDGPKANARAMFLTNSTSVHPINWNVDLEMGEWSSRLGKGVGGARVKPFDLDPSELRTRDKPVLWITKPRSLLTTRLPYLAFGNEAALGFSYGTLVLIVDPTVITQ
ncbi:hypothetical protein CC1G_00068 [Coprinopsis cinerea okayama7|uniref:Prolyl 4-hydroxylase alpha subunit Fe(2+) 2OG dioxygenase domain-containing protein n=1 Tax=Coprinopsis cinerea (strain Okayama-7 / 130 / ATCC MYA-4618 / FGSC 9003) TaxID=240176 RepID=A8NWM4_COPC7|nr:hypothetical protein CC1G_00068 [Coprinopsis cinerea okayama7\|eukprot:XP_001836932.2 hypothetical protein CC1G_00068 [Coprinopsis cinerea okayama7\